jgi:pyruvate/2-oxoglutarate dehydrogenase complex dihydrolipoamide dehydrogenase (E3) component
VSARNAPWDLLVLGGGTAGIVGAKTAARLGARVALVERERTGGDCLWTGCVPSKSLLAAAGHAAGARAGSALGVHVSGVRVDFPAVMQHVRAAIAHIEPVDSVASLEAAGVHTIHGQARFTGARTIEVDGVTHTFHQALLATGAAPAVPQVPGLADAQPLTSESVWDLRELPRRLIVMGGGSIGCELGQAFARLGAQVTLVEALPRILSREDPDAARLVQDALQGDGVDVLVGHRVAQVLGEPGGPGVVLVDDGTTERELPYDALLVAVGRSPRSRDLGLELAGVDLHDHGAVRTDARLRTSNPRIYAAGDVTVHPAFTHVAGVHASLAASNAVLGLRRTIDLSAVPRVTFTDPEVAAVGAASWPQEGQPVPHLSTRLHTDVDRAVAEGRTDGFTRLVLDGKSKTVIGGTVVGPRAGEALAEVTLAIRKGLTVTDLAATIHAYPTYADGVWNAAIDVLQDRLAAPLAHRATSALVTARRAWTARGSGRQAAGARSAR